MKNNTTIALSKEVKRRLIEKAQAEGRPLSDVIEEMCERQLEAESQVISVDTLQFRT